MLLVSLKSRLIVDHDCMAGALVQPSASALEHLNITMLLLGFDMLPWTSQSDSGVSRAFVQAINPVTSKPSYYTNPVLLACQSS